MPKMPATISAEEILASVMHTVEANTSWHDSCEDAAAHLVPALQQDLRVAFPACPDITVHCKPYAGTGGMECFYVGHYSGLATERGQQLAEDLGLLIVRTGQLSGTAPSSHVWFPICRGRSGWRLSVLACMGVRDQQLFGNILGWTTNVWGHQVVHWRMLAADELKVEEVLAALRSAIADRLHEDGKQGGPQRQQQQQQQQHPYKH